MQKYKFLEHTADIKFQAFGKNLKEVFENSVLAVAEVLSKEKKIKTTKVKSITIEGGDNEKILQSLLEEILYLLDAEEFITAKAKIDFDETVRQLRVKFYGDDLKNYRELNPIKAVTYNEMFVKKIKDKWVAQVVLDV